MASQAGEDVYATLLLNDTYLPGALVVGHSLRDAGTTKKLAVLVTTDTVSAEVITQLRAIYDYVIPVPRIQNNRPANLHLMNRADLHSAFTKINLWKQMQFRKIVYIDADVVAYRAVDELFDLPHAFAAAPDIGWPDLFNSGVMVITPNMGDYYALLAMAERGISFDGADQGLLNLHFKNRYHRLSFTYNVTPSAHYQYLPAYRHFQSSINMVHFIGRGKPWFEGRNASNSGSPFDEMVGRWWAVYDRHYRYLTSTPTGASSKPQINPGLVQHFVKGEYQPPAKLCFVVPVGFPTQDQGTSSHGQHHGYSSYSHDSTQQHQHYHESQSQSQSHSQHHDTHHEQHHGNQHQHQHQHQHIFTEQSQPSHSSASPPKHATFGSQASPSTTEGTIAEAQTEQVSAPPQHEFHSAPQHPEHKPEPPKAPIQESTWDAQRHPPPQGSKPEAFNLPVTQYEMSSDPAPFVPPVRYPSPPKGMWYEVPKTPPAAIRQKPAAIFPWETHRSRASRVFANEEVEDLKQQEHPSSEQSALESLGQSSAPAGSGTSAEPSVIDSGATTEQKSEPVTPTIQITPSDPWSSFTLTNAWDDVPGIERYVDAIPWHRRNKSGGARAGGGLRLGNLGISTDGQEELQSGFRRRGSRVTDFPSAVERPSLPVTPAPIRRPRFWGVDGPEASRGGAAELGAGEDDDSLPTAEGVPAQRDWDPLAQLQILAEQQSELLMQKLGGGGGDRDRDGSGGRGKEIPSRSLPFGSEDAKSPTYVQQTAPVLSPRPIKAGPAITRNILGDGHAVPEQRHGSLATGTAAMPRTVNIQTSFEKPSYTGPGLAWDKDSRANPTRGVPAALPSEEEKDVLEA